ncbi:hypothetical protein BDN70DRAFT_880974 [Pholiota conissans]|uniref:F-box domain-containing protein n=1 Tax=Pholiota conissans TaxID=109636 RepID=A0A9P5YYT8_9AGAR|nr:hypothetical protein BDN70DRAFT_880974 [Pholiota conissans]
MSDERLYRELCDYIIDFLHDDEASLRACALVCRSWVPASRTHLFYHLKLTGCPCTKPGAGWAPNTSCRRIYGTLLSSPHLTGYINKLSVNESRIYQPAHYRWVSGEIMFPQLLKKLHSLKELEFNFPVPGSSDPKTVWSTMVFKDISDAMSVLNLEIFTLRQFAFSTLADFVKVLDSWKNLKALQLDGVDIMTATHLSVSALEHVLDLQVPSPARTYENGKPAFLERLLLRSNSSTLLIPILLHNRSPLELSNLKSLVINTTSENYGHVLELLKITPNLENLELEIETIFDFEAQLISHGIINLHLVPFLKRLSLHFSLLLARTDPIPWINSVFSTITPGNTLADVAITCVIDKPPPTLTIQTLDNSLAQWRFFDDLLTQSIFTPLRRFRLDFALDSPIGDETLQQISNEYIKQLRNLNKRGILEVDVCEIR